MIGLRGGNPSSNANPFTDRPIEEPPKAVQGQMLRMTRPRSRRPPTERARVNTTTAGTTTSTTTTTSSTTATTTSRTTSLVDVEFPRSSLSSTETDRQKEFVSDEVLEAMLDMIETGVISSETVIEEMINNGILPVEVLEIGRLPITVGRQVMADFEVIMTVALAT